MSPFAAANEFLRLLPDAVSLDHWYDSLLEAIATHIVANRPNRIETRGRKRRPEQFKNIREYRSAYKTRLRSTRYEKLSCHLCRVRVVPVQLMCCETTKSQWGISRV